MGASDDRDGVVIEVADLECGYGAKVVVPAVSFEVARGEILAVLGGSGCGKTTLIRTMIGLLPPLSGRVLMEGDDLWGGDAAERNEILSRIGVMFQSGALFGSMTLAENVVLPLEEKSGLPREACRRLASFRLRMVGLGGAEEAFPSEVSGGMRKRAAIARAMALEPRILFLDEPNAGLDPVTSSDVDALVRRLSGVLGVSVILVTHEIESVLAIAHRAILLAKDRGLIAVGAPSELRRSEDDEVRRFFEAHTGPIEGEAKEAEEAGTA